MFNGFGLYFLGSFNLKLGMTQMIANCTTFACLCLTGVAPMMAKSLKAFKKQLGRR